jgi:hypothetical protein
MAAHFPIIHAQQVNQVLELLADLGSGLNPIDARNLMVYADGYNDPEVSNNTFKKSVYR